MPMIQDELCGQTVTVMVEIAVEDVESALEAKDVAVNFVDSALTKYVVSGALALGTPLSIGEITAGRSAKTSRRQAEKSELDAGLEAEINKQGHAASVEKHSAVIGGLLTGLLFMLGFLIEVLR